MKTTLSKVLLGIVVCLVLGLSFSITLISNKHTQVQAQDTYNQVYELQLDNINSPYGLLYGDTYNGEYLLSSSIFNGSATDYDFYYNGAYYRLYILNMYNNIHPYNINNLDNSYTFYFSTPMFYDGFDNLEDDEGNAYTIDYVDDLHLCYLSFFTSSYNTTQNLYTSVQNMIDEEILNFYGVQGSDLEGQTVSYYYTSINNISSMFSINSNDTYLYFLIKADYGYFECLENIYNEIFTLDGITYNYPSIYLSSIQPTTIVENQTIIGYSEAELQEAINREIQDYIQNDGYRVYLDGIDLGRQQGYDEGYRDGKRDGLVEAPNAFSEYTNILTTAWDGARQFLSTPILGNLTILHLILIPLLLGIFLIILKLIRG